MLMRMVFIYLFEFMLVSVKFIEMLVVCVVVGRVLVRKVLMILFCSLFWLMRI